MRRGRGITENRASASPSRSIERRRTMDYSHNQHACKCLCVVYLTMRSGVILYRAQLGSSESTRAIWV